MTADIAVDNVKPVNTKQLGDAIVDAIKNQ